MGKKILLIDDDRTFIIMVQSILGKEGYEILTAPDGTTGFDLVISKRPDVIILDVLMPGMTGYEFFQKLKKEGIDLKRMPTIVISSRKSMQNFFESWEVFGFLTKPFKPEELIEKVKDALAQKEDHEKIFQVEEPVHNEAKKALLCGFEDYILNKVQSFLGKVGYNAEIINKPDDVIMQVTSTPEMPDVIISQYHRNSELWDSQRINEDLQASERTKIIPLVLFCPSDMATDALKVFKSSQVVPYGKSAELERKLCKHLEKLHEGNGAN